MGDPQQSPSRRDSSQRPAPALASPPSGKLSSIHQGCRDTKLLLRVHAPSSASPLIWTGDISSSGFSSPNDHMGYISPTIYKKTYIPELTSPPSPSSLPITTDGNRGKQQYQLPSRPRTASGSGTGMVIGPYLKHTMIDHISEKTKQTCIPLLNTVEDVPDGVFPDEKTPWISTSSEAFWCIWEIARRLSLPAWADTGRQDQVELAVLRHPISTAISTQKQEQDHRPEIGPSQIRQPSKDNECKKQQEESSSEDRLPTELYVHPALHLHIPRPMSFNGEITLSLQESYDVCRKVAVMSGEVLIFARIFAENILENHVFTRKATPFPLPDHLLRPQPQPQPRCSSTTRNEKTTPLALNWLESRQEQESSTRGRSRGRGQGSWLDKLVWDPRTDEYPAAREKVLSRRREMSSDKRWFNEPL